ncbi:hypothetical protein [Pseudanabaena sp. PCC 6802]|uniref:hypothetical protein n=1 Tax=Pseudanabaena sp. PCC 6802 TaxID=118173 RepID=UPI00035D3A0C|nr:hypothetical protein [Pseudanabaena sp. PCC 6802]
MILTNRNLLLLGFAGVVTSTTTPAIAQNCRSLSVVGGTGKEVTKRVSPPGTLLTKNNWNTDFAVPSGARFNRFNITLSSQNDATYAVKVFLKYSNNTTDNFVNQNVPLRVGQSVSFKATPRLAEDPFQVNVNVGGTSAIGNTYTLSVTGCY